MLKNYFRIAWANVQKHKVYAAINVSGLAVSIAACLLIFVVVKYELSFDRFQKNYGSIYRIVTEVKHTAGSEERNPGIPYPAYDVIKAELPQFKKVVALNANSGMQVTVLGSNANSDVAMSKKFIEPGNVVFTMPEYFDVFNADFLQGSPKVLLSPENVIIDTTTAKKYFGSWQTAVGQFVKLDNAILLKVAGIIKDAPENSDFPIRFFLSYEVFKNILIIMATATTGAALAATTRYMQCFLKI